MISFVFQISCFVVLKEAGQISAVKMSLCVAEEVNHVLEFTHNKFNLFSGVIFPGRAKLSRALLKIVRLGSFRTKSKNFFDAAFSISPFEVWQARKEFHQNFQLWPGIHAQVLVSYENSGNVTFAGVFDDSTVPLLHLTNHFLNPALPPVGVLLIEIETGFQIVASCIDEVQPRQNNVKGISNYAHNLLCLKLRRVRHAPWGVGLHNPHSVVNDILTFHLLHLKHYIDVQGVISTSLNTSQQLRVLTKKSVARSWERGEGNFVRFVGCSIEESELTLKHPRAFFPEFLIA